MTEEKIKYIEKNKDNISIYKIIINNNIPYTENSNGIFINLSKLSDNNIDILYKNLKNNCYTDINNERNDLLQKYKKIINNKNSENSKNTIIEKKVYKKFENLSEQDLQIIEYSKKI